MGFKISVETISPPNFQRSDVSDADYCNNIMNPCRKSRSVLRGILFALPGQVPFDIPFFDILALVIQFLALSEPQ